MHLRRTLPSASFTGIDEWEEPEEWEKERPYLPDLTVYPDDEPADTGLVDQHGRKIMRSDKQQIGFLRFD